MEKPVGKKNQKIEKPTKTKKLKNQQKKQKKENVAFTNTNTSDARLCDEPVRIFSAASL